MVMMDTQLPPQHPCLLGNTLTSQPRQSSEIQAQKQTVSNGDNNNKDLAEKD